MKTAQLFLTISVVLASIHLQAQLNVSVNKSDSIKSLVYNVYKVKTKSNKIYKSQPTVLFDGYPIQYPLTKYSFNKDGLVIEADASYQKDTIYYNSKNQKIKMVIYPNKKRDSITFDYTYDNHGNIESIKKYSSAPKLDYSLNGNFYPYSALIDEFYKNFYLFEDKTPTKNQFKSIKTEQHCKYRLYNDNNVLVEEKYLTIRKNPSPYKQDSTIHVIKYQYTKDNRLRQISNINKHINAIGKNYTSVETEQHKYLKDGLVHEIKYFSNDKIWREVQSIYNLEGALTEYRLYLPTFNLRKKYVYDTKGILKQYTLTNTKNNKIKRNITLQYTFDRKGNWITCIHFDKKNRPKFLIERIIEYY